MTKRIIIAAGGTGGHVFPALCLAHALSNKNYKVEFITDNRGFKYLSNINDNNIKITIQNINNKHRIILYFAVIKNIILNLFNFIFNRPYYIIGFGGYPAFAPVFAGQLLIIKNAIHEQNAVIGKANKLLAKLTNNIFTSFENTLGINNNKIICTGNPTRYDNLYDQIVPDKAYYSKNNVYNNIEDNLNNNSNNIETSTVESVNNYEINDTKIFVILIFGGSQGAAIFADTVTNAICKLSNKYKIKIYQQARQEDIYKIQAKYSQCNIEYSVNTFFSNIDELYIKSDLVIARAGASSIFEIIGFKKPAILIPYSKSINGDQMANATYLAQKNAAIVFNDNIITCDILYNKIKYLIENKEELASIPSNLYKINIKNSTNNLLQNVLKNIL